MKLEFATTKPSRTVYTVNFKTKIKTNALTLNKYYVIMVFCSEPAFDPMNTVQVFFPHSSWQFTIRLHWHNFHTDLDAFCLKQLLSLYVEWIAFFCLISTIYPAHDFHTTHMSNTLDSIVLRLLFLGVFVIIKLFVQLPCSYWSLCHKVSTTNGNHICHQYCSLFIMTIFDWTRCQL